MNRTRINFIVICLVLLCLGMCLSMVGTSYARYQQIIGEPTSMYIEGRERDVITLYGGDVSYAWLEQNSMPDLESSWTVTAGGAELKFSVTNGESLAVFAQRDQEFRIRLIAGLSIEKPENLQVTLVREEAVPAETTGDGLILQAETTEQVTFTGKAEEIVSGTALYHAYGDGWVYRFYDEKGEEIVFELPGGALEYQNFKIQVSGEVSQTLLTMQVIGDYS